MDVFFLFPILFFLFWCLVALFLVGFWILMIVDVIQNETLEDTNRTLWIIIVIFGNWVGALVYFIAERPRKRASSPPMQPPPSPVPPEPDNRYTKDYRPRR